MTIRDFVSVLNEWGAKREPFFFMIDFELSQPLAYTLNKVDPKKILFSCNGFSNAEQRGPSAPVTILARNAPPFDFYKPKFDLVYHHLCYGDSYLVNLTSASEIVLSHKLKDVYHAASARYKLWFDDRFVVFSPECFVRIEKQKIFSFPMKGTIDASVQNAHDVILNDEKELAEHVTIVDLIRNDLSQVATNVRVTRFRYIEEIVTRSKNLLQVSSEICGDLEDDYYRRLGDILYTLLPAGSISGAPKKKTVEIIRAAEGEDRGYYTGVFGYFDGEQLESGVMIRYIEKRNDRYYYRSGGGITTRSEAEKEYQEILDKVYVPVA